MSDGVVGKSAPHDRGPGGVGHVLDRLGDLERGLLLHDFELLLGSRVARLSCFEVSYGDLHFGCDRLVGRDLVHGLNGGDLSSCFDAFRSAGFRCFQGVTHALLALGVASFRGCNDGRYTCELIFGRRGRLCNGHELLGLVMIAFAGSNLGSSLHFFFRGSSLGNLGFDGCELLLVSLFFGLLLFDDLGCNDDSRHGNDAGLDGAIDSGASLQASHTAFGVGVATLGGSRHHAVISDCFLVALGNLGGHAAGLSHALTFGSCRSSCSHVLGQDRGLDEIARLLVASLGESDMLGDDGLGLLVASSGFAFIFGHDRQPMSTRGLGQLVGRRYLDTLACSNDLGGLRPVRRNPGNVFGSGGVRFDSDLGGLHGVDVGQGLLVALLGFGDHGGDGTASFGVSPLAGGIHLHGSLKLHAGGSVGLAGSQDAGGLGVLLGNELTASRFEVRLRSLGCLLHETFELGILG